MTNNMNDLVCLSCDTVNESEFYRDGVCGNCQTLADTATPCPLGDGGYDCTPFCPSCAGAQFQAGMPTVWQRADVVVCDGCNSPMLPNVSTWDGDGCAWICATPTCGDYSGDELESDDLVAVGVPEWVSVWLVAHIENLATAAGQ